MWLARHCQLIFARGTHGRCAASRPSVSRYVCELGQAHEAIAKDGVGLLGAYEVAFR